MGGSKMKPKTLSSILLLIIAVSVIIGGCATGKKAYVATKDEELYGTWINPEYDQKNIMAKWILKPDGTFDAYSKSTSNRVFEVGTFTIADKWTDSEGNIYYKYSKSSMEYGSIENPYTYYFLVKIHATLDIAEELWSSVDYPTEFDPDNLRYNYWVFYRQ